MGRQARDQDRQEVLEMQELKLQNCGTILAGMLLNVDPFAHIAK